MPERSLQILIFIAVFFITQKSVYFVTTNSYDCIYIYVYNIIILYT